MRTPLLLACLLLSACDPAPTPTAEAEARPAAGAAAATQGHELQQAIDSVDHRDKAAAAGDAVQEADRKREQDLEDSGG